jgi:hypothetical protein
MQKINVFTILILPIFYQVFIFRSILKSEILIQESAEIDVLPKGLKRYRTSNDSIIDEEGKVALIDGHYIEEMDYTKMKTKNASKCG